MYLHLFALHPENSPVTTPDLAAAAKKTLKMRGDEGNGWSFAWNINSGRGCWMKTKDTFQNN